MAWSCCGVVHPGKPLSLALSAFGDEKLITGKHTLYGYDEKKTGIKAHFLPSIQVCIYTLCYRIQRPVYALPEIDDDLSNCPKRKGSADFHIFVIW